MKRIVIPIFLGFLFLTLQATWPDLPLLRRIRPDLILILTLYLGLSSSPISGGMFIFFLGYLMDLFSGNSFGLYVFSRPFLFYGAQLFKDRVYLENFLSRSLFVFVFALTEGLVLLILLKALNPEYLPSLYRQFLNVFFPQSLLTALISSPLFSLFRRGSSLLYVQHGTGIGARG
jgi:rod shape-determining protein MreD